MQLIIEWAWIAIRTIALQSHHKRQSKPAKSIAAKFLTLRILIHKRKKSS
jgi:hypothetical protein